MIFSQSCEKTLQCHRIVRVVDHQSKLIGYLDHLDTSFDSRYFESFDDVFLGNLEMTADGDRSQGIVNAEFTWNIDFYREVHKTFDMVGNSQISFAADHMCIFCAKVCLR